MVSHTDVGIIVMKKEVCTHRALETPAGPHGDGGGWGRAQPSL